TADLHQAIRNAWVNHGIDHEFKKYWSSSKKTEFPSLHETEAGADQPFPYCVYDQGSPSTVSRASDTVEKNSEYREVPWDFQIFAKAANSRSAKDIAQELYEVLLSKFGGHPTDLPIDITMTNGGVYQVQYQNDLGQKEGDDEYSWRISYLIQAEFP